MKSPKIVVYARKACASSLSTKVWLEQHKYSFKEIDLDDEKELKSFQSSHPDLKDSPHIFVDNKYLGGFSELLRSKLA